MSERRIDVPILARVEGEGALELVINGDKIERAALRIYEPPRFFERFLEGRQWHEIPDIVARICGICPVAYQISAVNALEHIFQFEAPQWITDIRRVLYLGEWIESHALHIHLLAAPDFFGCQTAIELAAKAPEVVQRGFRLQALGNKIMRVIGGRSVHPVSVCVGGLHKAPPQSAIDELLAELPQALKDAEALCQWVATIEMPEDSQPFTSVALMDQRYAVEQGVLKTSSGLRLTEAEYEAHFAEEHCPYSTALWSYLDGKPYLVGPLARLNLQGGAFKLASQPVQQLLEERFPSQRMFDSMLARAIEIWIALDEVHRLLQNYAPSEPAKLPVNVRAGVGQGWSEAPRGLLWHQYQLDENGVVVKAKLVPPTSQNQARLEEDLIYSLEQFGIDKSDQALRLHAEKVIRNYDPCISCATHFLTLKVNRV